VARSGLLVSPMVPYCQKLAGHLWVSVCISGRRVVEWSNGHACLGVGYWLTGAKVWPEHGVTKVSILSLTFSWEGVTSDDRAAFSFDIGVSLNESPCNPSTGLNAPGTSLLQHMISVLLDKCVCYGHSAGCTCFVVVPCPHWCPQCLGLYVSKL